MSDISPHSGLDLAGQQPTPVPLFSSFDWASDSEPEDDPPGISSPYNLVARSLPTILLWAWNWLLLLHPRPQLSRVLLRRLYLPLVGATASLASAPCSSNPTPIYIRSATDLAADLDMAATFDPTAPVLKGAFEALYLQFVGATATQASAPSSSDPPPMSIGSPADRYHLLSTHTVGGFLAVVLRVCLSLVFLNALCPRSGAANGMTTIPRLPPNTMQFAIHYG
jgi:hypothetical protein